MSRNKITAPGAFLDRLSHHFEMTFGIRRALEHDRACAAFRHCGALRLTIARRAASRTVSSKLPIDRLRADFKHLPEGIVHQPNAAFAIRDDEAVGQRADDRLDAEFVFLNARA